VHFLRRVVYDDGIGTVVRGTGTFILSDCKEEETEEEEEEEEEQQQEPVEDESGWTYLHLVVATYVKLKAEGKQYCKVLKDDLCLNTKPVKLSVCSKVFKYWF